METPFNIAQTWLQCIGCGRENDLLDERTFKCPVCGNLFDVMHTFPAQKDFNYYTKMFDRRAISSHFHQHNNPPQHLSGVWRFHEWVMPYLPSSQIISLGEGNVPIVRAGDHLKKWIGGDLDLWLILEGMTPTGSFKDFGGTVMISIAKATGIKAIGCASTGDTSAMAAAYASAAGMDCVVVLPKGKVTASQLAQPLVHGARVITLPGSFDDCMRVVKELVNAGLLFPVNSLNPTRIEGHQASVFLTAQFFNWKLPDWYVLPVGNGSNCSSVGKAIRLMKKSGYSGKMARILGCQSEAASPLADSWIRTGIQYGQVTEELWKRNYVPQKQVGFTSATAALIGNPVSWEKVIREIVASDGYMNVAPEHLLNEAVAICGKDGHFVCPQTGTALAGIKLAVESKKQRIKPGSRVVVVSTANGLKFTESATTDLVQNIIDASDCSTETVAKIMGL